MQKERNNPHTGGVRGLQSSVRLLRMYVSNYHASHADVFRTVTQIHALRIHQCLFDKAPFYVESITGFMARSRRQRQLGAVAILTFGILKLNTLKGTRNVRVPHSARYIK